MVLIVALPVLACMAIPVRRDNSKVEMQLTEQRALIYESGGNEHLILSVKYNGATPQFAWVVPTEGRPTVEVQKGAPFHELWRLTEIREPPKPGAMRGDGRVTTAEAPVVVLERKVQGPYELVVLQATESGGLFEWLKKNGFGLNPGARDALEYYVRRRWYFAAARIRPGGADNQQIQQSLKEGTIAALHLTYKARELSYPLRVTTGNPGSSKMEVYVLGNSIQQPPMLQSLRFQLTPSAGDGFSVQGPPGIVASEGKFATLRGLFPKGGTLYKFTGVLSTVQRNRDMVFRSISAQRTTSKPQYRPEGHTPGS